MSNPQTTIPTVLTTDQKRDIIKRALAFLNQAADEGLYFTTLDDSHDPSEIICDLTNALGLNDCPLACAAFLEQIT